MPNTSANQQTGPKALLLVNKLQNPDAALDESTFSDEWQLIDAPAEWEPSSGLPTEGRQIQALVVFARKYAEKDALAICKAIRDCPEYSDTPLVAAISMYQMPLGNDVKRLDNANMVFMPVKEPDLVDRLSEIKAQ